MEQNAVAVEPDFKKAINGLMPVAIVDVDTNELLTLAWTDPEGFRLTRECGEVVLWARSRWERWHKGATSGNIQKVVQIFIDCEGNSLKYVVKPAGPACHTGAKTCYSTEVEFQPKS